MIRRKARFAAAKLEGDRLRRELAGPWEEGAFRLRRGLGFRVYNVLNIP